MEILIAITAIAVFACWFVDNLWPLKPPVPNILKLIILAVAIFVIANRAGFI